tara:strand:- start:39 stop:1010 length:972 start_codon:yes stop_codon:yes gene_type:complete
MLTQQYIKELLYQHECVTVPNFGAFLTRSMNILIDTDSGLFVPPRKEVSFNSLLSNNDGVLAHYIAQKEKVSFEQALRRIEKEVISWKQRLNTQQLSFPGIGEIRLNKQKKIIFYPDGKINFDLSAFGLSSFYKKPIKNSNNKLFNPPQKMEKENKENLMFTPGKKEEKRKPFLKYVAIGLIGIALAGSLYYFGNQYVANEKIKSMELAQKKIKSNVQKATFDLGSVSKMNLSFNSEPEVIKNAPLDKTYFSVVAGSFRSIENAERLLKKLILDGFQAAFTEVNPEGLYRVAYGRFVSKREALNLHNYIRYALKEDAWFLVEK